MHHFKDYNFLDFLSNVLRTLVNISFFLKDEVAFFIYNCFSLVIGASIQLIWNWNGVRVTPIRLCMVGWKNYYKQYLDFAYHRVIG